MPERNAGPQSRSGAPAAVPSPDTEAARLVRLDHVDLAPPAVRDHGVVVVESGAGVRVLVDVAVLHQEGRRVLGVLVGAVRVELLREVRGAAVGAARRAAAAGSPPRADPSAHC